MKQHATTTTITTRKWQMIAKNPLKFCMWKNAHNGIHALVQIYISAAAKDDAAAAVAATCNMPITLSFFLFCCYILFSFFFFAIFLKQLKKKKFFCFNFQSWFSFLKCCCAFLAILLDVFFSYFSFFPSQFNREKFIQTNFVCSVFLFIFSERTSICIKQDAHGNPIWWVEWTTVGVGEGGGGRKVLKLTAEVHTPF